jgi:hypothetical protein
MMEDLVKYAVQRGRDSRSKVQMFNRRFAPIQRQSFRLNQLCARLVFIRFFYSGVELLNG